MLVDRLIYPMSLSPTDTRMITNIPRNARISTISSSTTVGQKRESVVHALKSEYLWLNIATVLRNGLSCNIDSKRLAAFFQRSFGSSSPVGGRVCVGACVWCVRVKFYDAPLFVLCVRLQLAALADMSRAKLEFESPPSQPHIQNLYILN